MLFINYATLFSSLSTLKNKSSISTVRVWIQFTASISSLKVAGRKDKKQDQAIDTIKIYDLSTSSEIGSLTDPTVTVLSFISLSSSFPRNLLFAFDDGSVSIYDADPFIPLKTLTVHKKGINDMSVHPSGTLALTVGRDSCLGMVNLVRGRQSF